jgi:hypothetical protein
MHHFESFPPAPSVGLESRSGMHKHSTEQEPGLVSKPLLNLGIGQMDPSLGFRAPILHGTLFNQRLYSISKLF